MKKFVIALIWILLINNIHAQEDETDFVRQIFDNVLTSHEAHANLEKLCTEAPGRLLGSENSIVAIDLMKTYFQQLGVDSIYLQKFTTPAWRCDSTSVVMTTAAGESVKLFADALGPSPSTPVEGIIAEVVEVHSLEEVEKLGSAVISGKIVFYNRPWDPTFVRTFDGYGNAVDQRAKGPAKAAEFGAVGVVVRSVTNLNDYAPHTGSTRYGSIKIPAVAISTKDANLLSERLKQDESVRIKMMVAAESMPEITTYNLIAQIKGKEFPNEVLVVAGHIDSWFNTPGAHDDGAGVVMASDVLRIFKELNIQNKRTIRVVLYMDEELYQSGGKAYLDYARKSSEKQYLALEADAGAFTPRMFTVNAPDTIVGRIAQFQPYLKPYGIDEIKAGWGGVDIGPLKTLGVPLVGYGTDSQRYFDLHHSPNDTFDKINLRELQLGCGCMASLVYLVDKYGLEK